MTIDEAIKTFRSRKALAFADGYADQVKDYIEAMSMAIAALREKQERDAIIRDIKASMKPDDTYSVALVLELLGDEQNQPADTDSTPCFPGQGAYRK
jgi:hypothetical protein